MATFYGTVKGNRGIATKTGSKDSGIKVSAQSWEGSVITSLMENNGKLYVNVEVADGSESFGQNVFFGTLDEFKRKLSA